MMSKTEFTRALLKEQAKRKIKTEKAKQRDMDYFKYERVTASMKMAGR